jgi:hypothetical protein
MVNSQNSELMNMQYQDNDVIVERFGGPEATPAIRYPLSAIRFSAAGGRA